MKALIVDDERLARQRLHRLLSGEADVEVVGQCRSVADARDALSRTPADLLFLDVQMPRAAGFELLDAVAPGKGPAVVFVTAFEHYARQAFDVRACDYVLKPVEPSRLRVAVQRARELLGRREREAGSPAVAPPPVSRHPFDDAVLVRTDSTVLRIRLEEVDWIEAAGNYVHLHVGGKAHLLRETLYAFESRLPEGRFARIHRTILVSLDRVVAFDATVSGDFSVTLRDGTTLRMSRTYRGRIRDVFGRSI